ncbi:hypothetical protein SBF1_4570004 [Candidatus Desulfosporosinus infrequens]|uniref:Uncharacterized protein n=1 Tax=Candidatus Desulfosporosinus infrequens TaxID=2043169 RepID=A0A2U3LCF6_9FIRM|nr:hypothetical protein SBF1_4570004 [Candidatus Desulfosporosinus infrequens]
MHYSLNSLWHIKVIRYINHLNTFLQKPSNSFLEKYFLIL